MATLQTGIFAEALKAHYVLEYTVAADGAIFSAGLRRALAE